MDLEGNRGLVCLAPNGRRRWTAGRRVEDDEKRLHEGPESPESNERSGSRIRLEIRSKIKPNVSRTSPEAGPIVLKKPVHKERV